MKISELGQKKEHFVKILSFFHKMFQEGFRKKERYIKISVTFLLKNMERFLKKKKKKDISYANSTWSEMAMLSFTDLVGCCLIYGI